MWEYVCVCVIILVLITCAIVLSEGERWSREKEQETKSVRGKADFQALIRLNGIE